MASPLMDLFKRMQIGGGAPAAAQMPVGIGGTGLAEQAKQQLATMGYQKYVQEMRGQGLEPLPPEQWMQQNAGRGPMPSMAPQ